MKDRINARKKILALLTAVVLVCIAAILATASKNDRGTSYGMSNAPVWSGNAAVSFESGDGTAGNPYLISNGEQLRLLAGIVNGTITQVNETNINRRDYNNPNVHYKLSADILLNDTANLQSWGESYSPRNVWTPIGTDYGKSFNANFDGGNHTVSGLYLDADGGSFGGFFGYVDSRNFAGAEIYIRDLRLEDSVLTGGGDYLGSVVGVFGDGRLNLSGCYSNAVVESGTTRRIELGGIIGGSGSPGLAVRDCEFEGRASAPESKSEGKVGGIIGYAANYINGECVTLAGCVNRGTVIGGAMVGGVVGQVYGALKITDCGNEGRVVNANGPAGKNGAGGVIGATSALNVTDGRRLWNTGTVEGGTVSAGGIVGYMHYNKNKNYEAPARMMDLYNSGSVSSNVYAGGLYGVLETEGVLGDYTVSDIAFSILNAVNEGEISGVQGTGSAVGRYAGMFGRIGNFVNYDMSLRSSLVGSATNQDLDLSGSVYALAPESDGSEGAGIVKFFRYDGVSQGDLGRDLITVYLNRSWSAEAGYDSWTEAGQLRVSEGGVSKTVRYFLPVWAAARFGDRVNWDAAGSQAAIFSGEGTRENPYLISTPIQLSALSRLIGLHTYNGQPLSSVEYDSFNSAQTYYKLTKNLYLNDISNYGAWGKGDFSAWNAWTPIGDGSSPFKANFDGDGHTIYGMYLPLSRSYEGLFGVSSGRIANLKVEKALVTYTDNKQSREYVGGIVGFLSGGSVSDSTFNGKIVIDHNGGQSAHIGGIAAFASSGSIVRNCEFYGELTYPAASWGVDSAGGIVGSMEGATVEDCRSHGRIDAQNVKSVGGVAGSSTLGSAIRSSAFYGSLRGGYLAGGIVGRADETALSGNRVGESASVRLTIPTALKGNVYWGGIAGEISGGSMTGDVFSGVLSSEITGETGGYLLAAGGIAGLAVDSVIKSAHTPSSARIELSAVVSSQGGNYHVGGIAGEATGSLAALLGCLNSLGFSGDCGAAAVLRLAGICGAGGGGARIDNCVNDSDLTGIAADYKAEITNVQDQNVSVSYNYARLRDNAALVTGKPQAGNYFIDAATGELWNAEGNQKISVKTDVSRVESLLAQDILNAYSAENNQAADGTLLPLAERLSYFTIRTDGGTAEIEMSEAPVHYLRYDLKKPGEEEVYSEGFLIADGDLASRPETIDQTPVGAQGFSLDGWTIGGGNNRFFDFERLEPDRNYILESSYSLNAPVLSPSADIAVTYDGKARELSMNAQIASRLPSAAYALKYAPTEDGLFTEIPGGGDRYAVRLAADSGVYELTLRLSYTDAWGLEYEAAVRHLYRVAIAKAQISVAGLTAKNRAYDATVNVELTGGALQGICGDENGAPDEVTAAMPTAGVMRDKHVGADKPVSFDPVALAGADAGNYEILQPAVTVDISKARLTLNSPRAEDRAYDGGTAVTIFANGFVVQPLGQDDVSFDQRATAAWVENKNAGLNKAVTVSAIGLTGRDASNYECVAPEGLTVDIAPRQIAIEGLAPAYESRVYDATRSVALSGGALVGIVAGDEVSCLMPSIGSMVTKNVGANKSVTAEIPSLTGADAGNYSLSIRGEMFVDIVKKDVKIFQLKAVNRAYNKSAVVELTSEGIQGFIAGDDVSFRVPTTGTIGEIYVGVNKTVSVSWGNMQGTDAGNYNIVLPDLVTVDITPKPLSVEGITVLSRQYDGTLKAELSQEGASLKGVEAGDDVSFRLPAFGLLETADVGKGKTVKVDGIELFSRTQESILKNYTIGSHTAAVDILPREITAVWDSEVTFVYNGGEQAPSATAETGVNGEFAALLISGAQTNVGEYTATAAIQAIRGGKADNYALLGAERAFGIAKRGVTVTISEAHRYTEGTAWFNEVWNGNVTGLISGHIFTGRVSTALPDVGVYLSGGDPEGFIYTDIAILEGQTPVTGNYEISYDLTVVISESPIDYTVDNYIGIYDAASHSITLQVITPNVIVEYSTDKQNWSSLLPSFRDAGDYTVHFRLSADNYDRVDGSAVVNISPAEFSVTLTAEGGTYSGEPIAASFTTAGGITGDSVPVNLRYTGRTNGGEAYDGTQAPRSAGSYRVTATIDNPNYRLADTYLDFVIERAAAAIDTANVKTEYTYTGGEQTVASGATLNHAETALVYSDNTFTNVGTGSYTVRITAAQTDNYLAAQAAVQIRVSKAALSDATVGCEQIYDGREHGITVLATGFLGGDDMSAAKVVYGTDQSYGSLENILVRYVEDSKTVYYRMTFDNYEDLSGSAQITILPKRITIEGVIGTDRQYDGGVIVQIGRAGSLKGLETGDKVFPIIPLTGEIADKNAGLNKPVALENITLSGEHAGNYLLTQPAVTVNIGKVQLSVQGLVPDDKVYDGSADVAVGFGAATLVGLVRGDDVTVYSVTARAESPAAGVNHTLVFDGIELAGRDAENYTVTLPTGMRVNIEKRQLDFALTAEGGDYTGEGFPAEYTVSGWVSDDSGGISLRYGGTSNNGDSYDSAEAPHLAGSYTVTASVDNPNYSLGGGAVKSFVIARAAAVIGTEGVETRYVYTGGQQTVDSGATLNHGETTLVYSDNTFTNVGTGSYTVTITAAQTDNYEAASAQVTVTVAKAVYDMTKVSFADASVLADGGEHSVLVSGTLPPGVTVRYEGNGRREAGAYRVTAKFSGDAENYEPIADMSAVLTVRAANLSGGGGNRDLRRGGL